MTSVKDIYRLLITVMITITTATTALFARQLAVKGTITAEGAPVRYASVTFIDNSNSSVSYTAITDSTGEFDLGTVTGVRSNGQAPVSFKLAQNYPNPFASKTAISYALDKSSAAKVTIYNVLGQVVRNYSLGYQEPGVHGIIWNGRDNAGNRVAPGVYFYRLQAGGQSVARKMLFGVGAANTPVSLTGLLPSAASGSNRVSNVELLGQSFTVQITNTDSTSPLIVPQEFSSITVSSDTTFGFSILKLQQATVYSDSTEQLIEGFGAANAQIFYKDMTSAEVHTAFDSTSGNIGLTILRVSIPPDSTQFSQDVPTAKLAESLGAKVIATPWTPPAWMKTNNSQSGGSINPADYAAYAAHLKAFADTMASHGVPVYAVSVQNEPDANVGYQSCYWSPTNFLDFMRGYAAQVGVPVFMPESEGFNHTFSDPTLNDSVACANTAFVGGHLYGDVNSRGDVSSSVQYLLALQKGKQLWMTEYLIDTPNAPPISSVDTGWVGGMATAKTISDCMNYDMSAYVTWEAARYYSMIGDGNYGTVAGQVTKKGFVMSQFARFIRPGYYRVFAPYNPQQNVYMTAYTGNGKTVIVVLNMNSNPTVQPIVLNNSSVTSFTPYVTTDGKNCQQESSVTVTSGKFTASLEASSVTTYVSN